MIKSTLSIIEKENSYNKLVSIVKYNMYSNQNFRIYKL